MKDLLKYTILLLASSCLIGCTKTNLHEPVEVHKASIEYYETDILLADTSNKIGFSIEEIKKAYTENKIRELTKKAMNNMADKPDIIPMIVDLDFASDVDDVCAVRVATSLHKLGKIDLKGISLCIADESIVSAMAGLLEYDKIQNPYIGKSALNIDSTSPYWGILKEYNKTPDEIVMDSVKLYRKLLSESKHKVTIVTTGYLTNIAELLKSEPDEYSSLNGIELVKEKVEALYITGGSYPDGYDNNFFFEQEARDAVVYIVENCKTPMYFISSNNGAPINCGGLLQKLDTGTVDPVTKSLYATGFYEGRAAWDPMSVWIAAVGIEESRMYEEKSNIEIDLSTGFNRFIPDENGKIVRLQRLDDNYDWYRNELDNLTLVGTPFESYIDNLNLEENIKND